MSKVSQGQKRPAEKFNQARAAKSKLFPETRSEDVFGSLAYKGKPKTVQEMKVGAKPRYRK